MAYILIFIRLKLINVNGNCLRIAHLTAVTCIWEDSPDQEMLQPDYLFQTSGFGWDVLCPGSPSFSPQGLRRCWHHQNLHLVKWILLLSCFCCLHVSSVFLSCLLQQDEGKAVDSSLYPPLLASLGLAVSLSKRQKHWVQQKCHLTEDSKGLLQQLLS